MKPTHCTECGRKFTATRPLRFEGRLEAVCVRCFKPHRPAKPRWTPPDDNPSLDDAMRSLEESE